MKNREHESRGDVVDHIVDLIADGQRLRFIRELHGEGMTTKEISEALRITEKIASGRVYKT